MDEEEHRTAPNAPVIMDWPGADMLYYPAVGPDFPPPGLLPHMQAELPWRRENIHLFGRTYAQPRLICWMGDEGCDYRYSGTVWKAQPWHPLIARLRDIVQNLTGASFNSLLLNLYRDGQDSISYHADDEPELGPEPVIASLSIGQERVMLFRHRHDSTIPTRRISLASGSLLIMRGKTQANWKHAIPKSRKAIGPRLNLTFRRIIANAE